MPGRCHTPGLPGDPPGLTQHGCSDALALMLLLSEQAQDLTGLVVPGQRSSWRPVPVLTLAWMHLRPPRPRRLLGPYLDGVIGHSSHFPVGGGVEGEVELLRIQSTVAHSSQPRSFAIRRRSLSRSVKCSSGTG